jgi:site-specific DNA recombinase
MQEVQQNNLRVALYSRVSTEEQREGQTIESQIKELECFANDKGWTIVDIYKDEGWSGTILARPELDRLRDDGSKGKFNAVLINDVDRLARDVTHLGVIKRDLEQHGVRVIFKKLPNDQSPTQNLLVNILGSFAEFERELIADRTRRGRRHKVETRQQFLGSTPPYGFRYIPKSKSPSSEGLLEIQIDEAAVVRTMYRWVDKEGLSARKVRDRLNLEGLRPRKNGAVWQKSSVLRILRNEAYSGVWYYNKHQLCEPRQPRRDERYRKPRSSSRLRPTSDWIPVKLPDNFRIIDPSQWRRVQEQMTRNMAFSPRNSKHHYLLVGLVRCGGCSATYVGNPAHGFFTYRCAKRCKAYASVSERSLDTTVWNAVKQALLKPEIIVGAITEIREHLRAEPTSGLGGGLEIKRGLEQLLTEESRVVEAYRLGVLSTAQLAKELEGIKARRGFLESQQSNTMASTKPSTANARRPLQAFCHDISTRLATLDRERQQQLLRLLLKGVVFEGTRVRIQGVIPLGDRDPASLSSPDGSGRSDSPGGSIATTASYLRGRNSPLASDPVRQPGEVLFELIREVEHDNTARIAASRANLLKAMAARWPKKSTQLDSSGKGSDPAANA